MPARYITAAAAARLLGVSRQRVRTLIAEGKLTRQVVPGLESEGCYLLRADVMAWRKQRAKRGARS